MQTKEFKSNTPTARLILLALRSAVEGMTVKELSQHTESSPATLADTCQGLVKRRLLIRRRVGNFAFFSLPEANRRQEDVRPDEPGSRALRGEGGFDILGASAD